MLNIVISIVFNLFKIIFLLGFLILIHEGGHFLAARIFKVKVEEFSIGFGPKFFKKQGKETVYSIGCIPLGGYVRMTGEEVRSEEERAFNKAKISHRIAIVAAGAIVNILFGMLIFFIVNVISGYNISTMVSGKLDIAKDNISAIEIGDKILKINDKKVRLKSDITRALSNCNGQPVKVLVERNNEELEFVVIPTEYSEGIYILGVEVSLADSKLNQRLYYSFWETIDYMKSVAESFKLLFTGKIKTEQLTGPIGISEIVVDTHGIYEFLRLMCYVSISLGATNLLPIPALDGGKIVLLLIEAVRRKPLKDELEILLQTVGLISLLLFSLYISYKDVLKIF